MPTASHRWRLRRPSVRRASASRTQEALEAWLPLEEVCPWEDSRACLDEAVFSPGEGGFSLPEEESYS